MADGRRDAGPSSGGDRRDAPSPGRGDAAPLRDDGARRPRRELGDDANDPPLAADDDADPDPISGTVPVGERVELTPPAEVARAALNRAKAAARAKGLRPGAPARRRVVDPQVSGARPGGRDPQLLGDTMARLFTERGWDTDVSIGSLIGRWREVVGDQVAEHCQPEAFDDGVLRVRADSTAWATQLQLLVPRLLDRLAQEVGQGVVQSVLVLGPTGPGFRRGRRTVRGPGARDTWG